MNLDELFDIGEQLELRNAKMYAHFALMHGEWDERIASFWEQMSTDEWQHFIVLNFCRGLCANNKHLDKPAPPIDHKALNATLEILDEQEKKIREGKEISLQEAFEVAITIEKGETDAIFDMLAEISAEVIEACGKNYLGERVDKARKQNDQHEERLTQAVRRFSRDPALVREAQKLGTQH